MLTGNSMLLTVMAIVAFPALFAQNVTGHWVSVDDRSGQEKAIVRIYRENGLLFGTIEKILVEGREDAVCTECSGSRKNQPIRGMKIINGLAREGDNSWKGGQESLFDPEQGKSFRSRIWINSSRPDELKVRGYRMFFYRTQTWKRAKKPK